ncbi:hypothetical protein HZS_4107 [Henneguya salminicola]|nr:hypothetical protein HZS_4107 [Henneguya salminicola]
MKQRNVDENNYMQRIFSFAYKIFMAHNISLNVDQITFLKGKNTLYGRKESDLDYRGEVFANLYKEGDAKIIFTYNNR